MIKKLDRRGDVPITILVLGVFAVCSLALFSFYLSGISGKETFLRVSIVEQTNSLANEIKFYKSPGIDGNPEEIMDIFKNPSQEDKLVFSGKKENEVYILNATYFESEIQVFGFNFGERKPMFSALYKFSPR